MRVSQSLPPNISRTVPLILEENEEQSIDSPMTSCKSKEQEDVRMCSQPISGSSDEDFGLIHYERSMSRSQPIPIPKARDDERDEEEYEKLKAIHNKATWRMYYRIQNARQVQYNRDHSDPRSKEC